MGERTIEEEVRSLEEETKGCWQEKAKEKLVGLVGARWRSRTEISNFRSDRGQARRPRMSEGYNVRRLISEYGIEIEGKLLLYANKVVFKPEDQGAEKIEIPTAKIKDAKFATKEDISALRTWLAGPVLGTLFKEGHKILVIDYEDQGIIEHLTLEGKDADLAMQHLHDMRKARSEI